MVRTIAIRYFFSKRKDKMVSMISTLSLVGVMLGVAALIVVMGIMRGFREELLRNVLGLNSHILISGIERIDNWQARIRDLSSITQIEKYMLTTTNEALMMSGKFKQGIIVKGIKRQDLLLKFKDQVHEINLKQKSDEDTDSTLVNHIASNSEDFGIAISTELLNAIEPGYISQKEMEILSTKHVEGFGTKGDLRLLPPSIQLVSGNITPSILGSIPRSKTFETTHIFSTNMYEYDMKLCFIDLDISRHMFGSSLDLEIYIHNPDEVDKVIQQIVDTWSLPHAYLLSWKTQNQSLIKALEIERISMFAILFLLVMVSAFNIISSLTLLVKDKMKDIAILKTIGMPDSNIMMIFFINGIMVGISGVVLGVVLGCALGWNIDRVKTLLESLTGNSLFDPVVYFLYHLPCKISSYDVAIISICSLSLCSIIALYPSYKATKVQVVDILQAN